MKNEEENIDEKTPKSKYRYLKMKFEKKIDENDEKNEKKEEKQNVFPKSSGILKNFLSQGLIEGESQKKGKGNETPTPSSVKFERKTAAFEARDQFLRNSRPVNTPLDNDGQKKRTSVKRKIQLNGESSDFLDNFSPRKIPRK